MNIIAFVINVIYRCITYKAFDNLQLYRIFDRSFMHDGKLQSLIYDFLTNSINIYKLIFFLLIHKIISYTELYSGLLNFPFYILKWYELWWIFFAKFYNSKMKDKGCSFLRFSYFKFGSDISFLFVCMLYIRYFRYLWQ